MRCVATGSARRPTARRWRVDDARRVRRARLCQERRVSARSLRDDRRRAALSHQDRRRLVRRAARHHRRAARATPRSSCAASPTIPTIANAIAVHYGRLQLGFFNKRLAAHLAPLIDAGARYAARVASLTGRLACRLADAIAASTSSSSASADAPRARSASGSHARRSRRRSRARGSRAPRADRRVAAARRPARRARARRTPARTRWRCSEPGAASRSAFNSPRRCGAFGGAGKTLVVYPLRALANDQYEALRRTLDPLGPALLSRQRLDRQRGTRRALRRAARGRVGRRAGDPGVPRVPSRCAARTQRAVVRRRGRSASPRTSRATAPPTRAGGDHRRARAIRRSWR